MTTQAQIKQQESAIEMLKMMVKAGRVRSEKLEAAINELNRMMSDLACENPIEEFGKSVAVVRQSAQVKKIMKDVNSDVFVLKSSALSEQAARLRKDQAELSNMLHKVPDHQPCPELVNNILALHEQIENIWDQKKYLERNQTDGPVNPAHDQQLIQRSVDAVSEKAELSVKLQKLREKQSKLTAKIANPKAGIGSKSKWEIELAQVRAGIDECLTKRALI